MRKSTGRGSPGSRFAAFGLFGLAAYLTAAGIALLLLAGNASCGAAMEAPFAAASGRCLAEAWLWFLRGLTRGLGGALALEPPAVPSLFISSLLAFSIAGILGMAKGWRGLLVFVAIQAGLAVLWGVLAYLRYFIR